MKPTNQTLSRATLTLLLTALWTVLGSSCQTMRGVGRDVQTVGDHLERAAAR